MLDMARTLAAALAAASFAWSATIPVGPEGFPFTNENLEYSLNFTSGVKLGKAHMTARRDPVNGWSFNFVLDASIPAFPIIDRFSSYDGLDLCSLRFDRNFEHGKRKAHELTWFDRTRSVAVRSTKDGGGLSEIPVGLCPHDGLSFFYYLRRELGQGRMPPNDVVLAGAAYRVSMVYAGEQPAVRDGKSISADQVNFTIKGPASETRIQILFARDAARTPLVVRCPFKVGTFSLELIR